MRHSICMSWEASLLILTSPSIPRSPFLLTFPQTKPAGTRSSTTRTCLRSCSTLPCATSMPPGSMREPTPFPLGETNRPSKTNTHTHLMHVELAATLYSTGKSPWMNIRRPTLTKVLQGRVFVSLGLISALMVGLCLHVNDVSTW